MKKIHLAALLLFISAAALAQNSPVILSDLRATPVIDAAAEKNSFMIEMTVSDPASLSRLEVAVQDGSTGGVVVNLYPVVQKQNKVELVFDKYAVPFEGQRISFFQPAHDQMKALYYTLTIKAYDKSNKTTNSLVYDQSK
ncbi:hypothetical protein KK083_19990 [Fulvivirgaceae bacterium PWU4]|uniref:DUF4625 domain-containing protein n=1 Tax=Chryseosolibacter histidini TaxID=2782349 RepID=A0AAP2GPJ4_9BACT|nr:hypothetical protein [Chryseosolibacter histidini]MBT1699188.1 hypothetical protein [Chryseosolibacter histidini]